MNLTIGMICPSHGVIWKEQPEQIVAQYLKWAANYQTNQVTIIYDTMWNSTRKMAEALAEGMREQDPTLTVKLMNAAIDDKNDIVTEVFKSKAIAIGSPTVNNGYTYAIAGILELLKGCKFKQKKAFAFGSYGWGGEAVKLLTAHLEECGFGLLPAAEAEANGIRVQWVPQEEQLARCRNYGKYISSALAE